MATCPLLRIVENSATEQATVPTRYRQMQLSMDLEYLLVLAKFYEVVWEAMVLPGVAHKNRGDMARMVLDPLRLNPASDRPVWNHPRPRKKPRVVSSNIFERRSRRKMELILHPMIIYLNLLQALRSASSLHPLGKIPKLRPAIHHCTGLDRHFPPLTMMLCSEVDETALGGIL